MFIFKTNLFSMLQKPQCLIAVALLLSNSLQHELHLLIVSIDCLLFVSFRTMCFTTVNQKYLFLKIYSFDYIVVIQRVSQTHLPIFNSCHRGTSTTSSSLITQPVVTAFSISIYSTFYNNLRILIDAFTCFFCRYYHGASIYNLFLEHRLCPLQLQYSSRILLFGSNSFNFLPTS